MSLSIINQFFDKIDSIDTKFLLPVVLLLGASVIVSIINNLLKISIVPSFVLDIIIGLVIGSCLSKDFLNNSFFNGIYIIGFILIMFISGYENNFFQKVQKNYNLKISSIAHVCLVLIIILSILFSLIFFNYYYNKTVGIVLITIVFSSTFAGIVVPLIYTDKLYNSYFGNFIIYFATLSELVSIVVLSIIMIVMDYNLISIISYGLIFLLFLVVWIVNFFFKKSDDKVKEGISYLPVRLIIVILCGCVILGNIASSEYILGAFLLGVFVKKINIDKRAIHDITSIGFGVFIPMFFIIVGLKVDMNAFVQNPKMIFLVWGVVILMVATKIPILIVHKWFALKESISIIILLSCTLVVGITISHIGVKYNIFSYNFGQVILMASIITCIVAPIIYEISTSFSVGQEYIYDEKKGFIKIKEVTESRGALENVKSVKFYS